ncbi:MAG: hypothetical protein LUE14_09160 [Clostridiales bacterium]|nr:hypothetical protein [Clostridiales bacterium]
MRRVFWTGSYGKDCVKDLNEWLSRYPEIELVDVKPVVNGSSTELFCIVNVPDSMGGSELPKKMREYFGMKEETK